MNFAQLVVDADGSTVRSLPRNPNHREDFENPELNQYVPALGSLDLLRLAIWSELNEFPVVDVELRDRSMSPIDDEVFDRARQSLLGAIREKNLAHARQALRAGDRSPYTLVAIEVETDRMNDIKVARSGEVEAEDERDIMKFVSSAWSALHLS